MEIPVSSLLRPVNETCGIISSVGGGGGLEKVSQGHDVTLNDVSYSQFLKEFEQPGNEEGAAPG